ncbi:MAG: Rpn family recombination-promoting nuclease/putative transposase [Lachnospiraceae bacterium]|nr:Rpn family recombination-promoting nuclease/putative transposase [Lachnospiraceae bacterium]
MVITEGRAAFGKDNRAEKASSNLLNPEVGNENRVLLHKTYQDSLFTKLYSSKETLLDLYQHLHPTDISVTIEDIEIITLCSTVIVRRYNDVAFKVGNRLMVLTEHQSTPNWNMPLRMLFYVASEYEKLIGDDKKLIFRDKLIKIPRPEFYVVYTGSKPLGSELRLSDAFRGEGDTALDLQVDIITESETDDTLGGYLDTVRFVKNNRRDGHISPEALHGFIKNYKGSALFKQFLDGMDAEEVVKMIDIEYDYEVEKEVLREEAREEGREEGIVLGAIDVYVDSGMDKSTIVTKISKKFKLDDSETAQFLSLYEKRYGRI